MFFEAPLNLGGEDRLRARQLNPDTYGNANLVQVHDLRVRVPRQHKEAMKKVHVDGLVLKTLRLLYLLRGVEHGLPNAIRTLGREGRVLEAARDDVREELAETPFAAGQLVQLGADHIPDLE